MEDRSRLIQDKVKNRIIELCQELRENNANFVDIFNELDYHLQGWNYNGNEVLKSGVTFVSSATDILPSKNPNIPRRNVYLLSEDRVVKFDRKDYTHQELEYLDQREQTMLEFYIQGLLRNGNF